MLDDLLARVEADHGPAAHILSAEKSRSGGLGGFFARERFEVVVEVLDETAPVGTTPDRAALHATTPSAATPDAAPSDGPVDAIDLTEGRLDIVEGADDFARLLGGLVAEQTSPAQRSVVAEPTDDPTAQQHRDPVRSRGTGGPVTLDRLLDRAATRALPAPTTPRDGVLCVMGPRAEATRAATLIARAGGRPAEDVVVVASHSNDQLSPALVATFVAELARQRDRRAESGPIIVVLELLPVLDGLRWAHAVLTALRPSQVRLAGTARWVLREVDNLLAAGVRTDVVDVTGVAELADPQRLLDMAIPVGTIDGTAADPAIWAAVLLAARTAPTRRSPVASPVQ